MKCISQMPTPPMDNAAMENQRIRTAGRVVAMPCRVHAKPMTDPRSATANVNPSSQSPIEKWFISADMPVP